MTTQTSEQIDELPKLDTRDLAHYVTGFRRFPAADGDQEREDRFSDWWRAFVASKKGGQALKTFEAARKPVRKRTKQSTRGDLITLRRLAVACHSAITWSKQQDPGNVYRLRISVARRQREKLAYHARQLAAGLAGWPPGLRWALRTAALKAGVGDIRGKLRKEVKTLPEAQRLSAIKELQLDTKRTAAEWWPEFFSHLDTQLRDKLPEIDGGPWYHLFTIGNLHYEKRIDGHVPALETMLAFELTFFLRRWSLGHAGHGWASGSRMPTGGKPHYEVSAAFVNAALNLRRPMTGEEFGNRLKRLPKGIGLIGWPHADG